jgi:thymidylate kinase
MSFEEVYAAHNYDRILIPDITFIFHLRKENIKKRLDTRG